MTQCEGCFFGIVRLDEGCVLCVCVCVCVLGKGTRGGRLDDVKENLIK